MKQSEQTRRKRKDELEAFFGFRGSKELEANLARLEKLGFSRSAIMREATAKHVQVILQLFPK